MRANGRQNLLRIQALSRLVALDFLRSRGLVLAGIFVGFLSVFGLAGRWLIGPDVESARFVLSFNLQASYWAALLLTWAICLRQIAPEIENRSLHLLLARPVGRAEILVVRTLVAAALGVVALLAFSTMIYLLAPTVPDLHFSAGLQMLLLRACAVLVLAVIATVLALLLPAASAAPVALGLVLLGGLFLHHATLSWPGALQLPLFLLVPDFSLFDVVEFFVAGQPGIAWATMVGIFLYVFLFVTVWLTAGIWVFQRREV
jgi:ABC-type transport system involved in multi-copper enzyme maturation permease subunit